MKAATIDWYFDFISPFAYLQWPRIAALGTQHTVQLRPILFAGLLDMLGTKGPAEIPAKRQFTYRFVAWRAQRMGIPLCFPPAHPFNPLPALRLALAAGCTPTAVGRIFAWIWAEGRAADSIERLRPLALELGVGDPDSALSSPQIKQVLRDNFDLARANAVFGVPTLAIDGELFWGEDASEFALQRLTDPQLFAREPYASLDRLPAAATRAAAV